MGYRDFHLYSVGGKQKDCSHKLMGNKNKYQWNSEMKIKFPKKKEDRHVPFLEMATVSHMQYWNAKYLPAHAL